MANPNAVGNLNLDSFSNGRLGVPGLAATGFRLLLLALGFLLGFLLRRLLRIRSRVVLRHIGRRHGLIVRIRNTGRHQHGGQHGT